MSLWFSGLTLKTSESCQQTTWLVLHLDSVPSRNTSSGSKATAKKTAQQQETFCSSEAPRSLSLYSVGAIKIKTQLLVNCGATHMRQSGWCLNGTQLLLGGKEIL